MSTLPRLMIGLGNPDDKYTETYHNIGALFAHYVKQRCDEGSLTSLALLATVSASYMNSSGSFVGKMLDRHRCSPADLLLVHDDSDIYIGSYKVVFGRGAAGHHGVEDVIRTLGTDRFYRLRIGVRDPKSTEKAGDFVLRPMLSEHKEVFTDLFTRITDELPSLLSSLRKRLP